jgi:hypothetical protein
VRGAGPRSARQAAAPVAGPARTDCDTVMTDIDDQVPQLTATMQAKWYNTITAALGLAPGQFQLLQPTSPLGNTSDLLWSYFNNLPPETLTSSFNPGGGNRFYDDYRAVLGQLSSQNDGAFQRDLGDQYDAWLTYVKTLTPLPKITDLPGIFQSWASVYAPDIAQKGATDLANNLNDPIFRANMAVLNQQSFLQGVPDFSQTIAGLRSAIQGATGASFSFDSSSASADTTKTWASGEVSGFWDIFTGSASTSYSHLTAKAASSSLTVTGTFKSVLTFAASPGSWFDSAALGAAFHTQDNTLWKHGTPSWDSTFGPNGNMNRFTTSLVVVDGIDATITSSATYSSQEQTDVKANVKFGIVPFFSLGASGGYSSDASFDDQGRMTVKISNPAGNPVVLGANVVGTSDYLGRS